MKLHEVSVKRHVLAFMMSAIIVLFGTIGYQRIGLDKYPNIDFPMISVTTVMVGANPEIIDSTITNTIESAVNSVPGIEHVMSRSLPGVSIVTVKFQLSKNIDTAYNEVQSKVNQVLRDIPTEADPPVINKVAFDATPILWFALQGDRTLQQLNVYASTIIKKQLENIDGVGEVRLGGQRDRTIRVNLDLNKMASYGITPSDVILAFKREHNQLPGGFLVSEMTEDLMKLDMEFHNLEDLQKMVIFYKGKMSVQLEDIAEVVDGLADARELATYNGDPTVSIGIIKVTGSNTVAIIDRVTQKFEQQIKPKLPPGMTLKIATNDADFIKQIVASLEEHIVLGTIFAALVVLFFLKDIRSTLIIAVAIPVSLLGAILVMYFGGFTFNTMTLLGLLLLIGVVVDDAIVVLENIFRHQEEAGPGGDTHEVAIIGTEQVIFAVMAATLTLVSIFAPVIFLGGVIGQFFKSFAIVVTFGVLTSLFVSLTLTPMLCSRYMKVTTRHGLIYRGVEGFLKGMENFYRYLLRLSLRFRWTVVVLTIGTVAAVIPLFGDLGKGFMPLQDEGRFLVTFKTPLGSTLDYTENRLKSVEDVLRRHKEVKSYLSTVGTGAAGQVSQGTIYVRMTPFEERNLHQYDLIGLLRDEMAQIPGVKAFPSPVPTIGGQRGEPLQFVLVGPILKEVADFSDQLLSRLSAEPELGKVDLDLNLDLPQLKLNIDRQRAYALGFSTQDVATAVYAAAGGLNVARYNDEPGDGERYDIRLKSQAGSLSNPADLSKIFLRTGNGKMVRLDTIAQFEKRTGAAAIPRYDLRYSSNFYATPTISLGEAVSKVTKIADEILPLGYSLKMTGRAEEFAKTAGYMKFTLIMALILVYMVLASQFNSFLQPIIVMVAQPLAIIGGIFGLWLLDHSLNIYSMIGLVLLMGLVAKNSILLVDLTNMLRNQGMGVEEALKEACPIRLRPVLMTSLTIILAMWPAAMEYGASSDTNAPLAVAIIGGMISSTLLTLVVVPPVYSLMEGGIANGKRLLTWVGMVKSAKEVD